MLTLIWMINTQPLRRFASGHPQPVAAFAVYPCQSPASALCCMNVFFCIFEFIREAESNCFRFFLCGCCVGVGVPFIAAAATNKQ